MKPIILFAQWIIIFLIVSETWIVFKHMRKRMHHYLFLNCFAMLLCSVGSLLMLFVETEESGKPVIGRGEIRSGLLEQSNTSFKDNMAHYQLAKVQMELVNALIKTNKDLLQSAMEMATQ